MTQTLTTAILVICSRWLHVATACVAIGGVFFLRVVLPVALRGLDPDPARLAWARAGRTFKFVVHACVLFTLATGTYNAYTNWPTYSNMGKGLGHGLFGLHLLLGLVGLGLLLWLFVGKEPRPTQLRWLGVTLGVLLLTTAAAAVLKNAREHPAPVPFGTTNVIIEPH